MKVHNFNIENLVRRASDSTFTNEYNCLLRRLFPWEGKVNTKRPITEFGCIWVVVNPQRDVDMHSHDEEEAFIVIDGEADLSINGQVTQISSGDVVYIPRFSEHQLRNRSEDRNFVMIDIYWDMEGKSDSIFNDGC